MSDADTGAAGPAPSLPTPEPDQLQQEAAQKAAEEQQQQGGSGVSDVVEAVVEGVGLIGSVLSIFDT